MLAIAALGACVTIGWLAWSADAEPALAVPTVTAAAADPVAGQAAIGAVRREAAEAAPLGCYGALPGAVFRHSIVDRCTIEVDSAEAGRQPGASVHAECAATTTVLARRAGEVLVQIQFDGLCFRDGDGRAIEGDAMQQQFVAATEAAVIVRRSEGGTVLGYGFADGLDGDQRNFLRGLLGAFAYAAPAADSTTWQASEGDTTGEYEARYELQPSTSAMAIAVVRTKLRYTAMASQQELPQYELQGSGRAEFSTGLGWLRESHLDESLTVSLPLLDLRAITRHRADAVLVDTGATTIATDLAGPWQLATAPVTGRFETIGGNAAASERRLWVERLQGVTVEALLADLQKVLAAQPADAEAIDAVFQQLHWLVKLDDQVAVAIGERIAAGALAADVAAGALGALGAAQTSAAQRVLAAVRADQSLGSAVREAATVATLQLAEPGEAIVDGLVRDAAGDGDGRDNAMLVLGALAARSKYVLPDGRTPLQALLGLEQEAAARGDLPTWLLAVGNAGTGETLAIAVRHLDHGDPAVRAAACSALRRVADPAAAQALQRVAQGDPSDDVRNQARELLRRRS